MIKRQYYTLFHPNHSRDNASASSSSSSSTDSSTLSGEAGGFEGKEDASWPASSRETDSSIEQDEVSEEEAVESKAGMRKSRLKEVKVGSPQNERITLSKNQKQVNNHLKNFKKITKDVSHKMVKDQWKEVVRETEREKDEELLEDSMVLHIGGVLKCKLCPKRLILSEAQLSAHLQSKGHARSLKLFREGRLKKFLNSDGEEEEEAETHAERHARTAALLEKSKIVEKKRCGGRQRQRKRAKRKAQLAAEPGKDLKALSEHVKSKRMKFSK